MKLQRRRPEASRTNGKSENDDIGLRAKHWRFRCRVMLAQAEAYATKTTTGGGPRCVLWRVCLSECAGGGDR
jgi:hypothetical protein